MEILVHKTDDDQAAVVAPNENDTEDVAALKFFLLACLHRRNLDENFDEEMYDWITSFTPEELSAATNEKRVKH